MTTATLTRRLDALALAQRLRGPWQCWPDAALLAIITGKPGAQLTDDELRRIAEGGQP